MHYINIIIYILNFNIIIKQLKCVFFIVMTSPCIKLHGGEVAKLFFISLLGQH